MELTGDMQSFDWGKIGCQSMVARLAARNDENFTMEKDQPYAQFSLESEDTGGAKIKKSGKPLTSELTDKFSYIFKIISINKPLGLQMNIPEDVLESLNEENPDVYENTEPKFEFLIALTNSIVFCGFKPTQEIYCQIKQLPALKAMLGGDLIVRQLIKDSPLETLAKFFEKIMKCDPEKCQEVIKEITESRNKSLACTALGYIFQKAKEDFPEDMSALLIFFLNIVHLKPGEAIFLDGSELYAPLCGNFIQLSNPSKNSINPDNKDVEVLLQNVNYNAVPNEEKLFHWSRLDAFTRICKPNVLNNFIILEVQLASCVNDYEIPINLENAIMLVMEGRRLVEPSEEPLLVERGSIIYISGENYKTLKLCQIEEDDPSICPKIEEDKKTNKSCSPEDDDFCKQGPKADTANEKKEQICSFGCNTEENYHIYNTMSEKDNDKKDTETDDSTFFAYIVFSYKKGEPIEKDSGEEETNENNY